MRTPYTCIAALCVFVGVSVPTLAEQSGFELVDKMPIKSVESTDAARMRVEVVDATSGRKLPVRVIVTGADGKHPDGSGRGVYKDGRFFADGSFVVTVVPGNTKIRIASGPNYEPITMQVTATRGVEQRYRVSLHEWFSPQKHGWYGGDNHVHAQHDAHAKVRTDLAYTALQGRANGLNFITESGSSVSYDDLDKLNTDSFLLRYAPEIRPGPFVGHLNTPGIRTLIRREDVDRITRRPLPAQAVVEAVHARDGAVIHTHPMTPVHLLHWMGAGEVFSDAVHRKTADLFDVDASHSQTLWFAVLNMGARMGVSGYTDAALGRDNTLSPGDRRVYCKADGLDYRAFVEAMRAGRTVATNGVSSTWRVPGRAIRFIGRLGRRSRWN